jgi:predicted RND superfamily exporter protein
VRERIATLLVYTNCIVQGVSFVLHKFESYHHADHHAETHATPVAHRWLRAMRSDDLIAGTGLIAIFGFATLYSFQVLSIREFGILSAIAVCYQLVLVTVFMPAAHTLLRSHSAEAHAPDKHRPSRSAAAFQRGLDALATACTRLATCRSPRGTAILWGSVTLGLVVAAALLIVVGRKLPVKMRPLDFIHGTLAERTALFLNEPNRIGFDVISFLVEPADGASDIYDPGFLQAAVTFEDQLRQATGAREIASIIDNVHRISAESLRKPLPATRAEARTVFNLIEGDLDPTVARQLYYPQGFRLSTSYKGDDTNTMGAIVDGVLGLAREHPTLRVSSFGKTAITPQVDDYVRWGKPVNLFTSQLVVIAFCLAGVWLRNRRARQHGRDLTLHLSPLGGGIMMSAPFLFATALMALVMMAFQAPLNAVTASITALAINASVDFAIYYAAAYQDGLVATGSHTGAIRHATTHKGRLVVEDMLLNTVCFIPLILSRFSPIRDVGWIMMAMLPACAFGSVVIMPALFYPVLRGAPLPRPARLIYTRVAQLACADTVPQQVVALNVSMPTEEEQLS